MRTQASLTSLSLPLQGQPLPIHGSGLAPRAYIYVTDAAAAFDIVLHKGCAGEVYNMCGRAAVKTPLEVAHDVRSYFGLPAASRVEHVLDRAFRDKRWVRVDSWGEVPGCWSAWLLECLVAGVPGCWSAWLLECLVAGVRHALSSLLCVAVTATVVSLLAC